VRRKGRKRPADAELLLDQVASEFGKQKERLGSAKRAAQELGVCLASFYKYLNRENIPDMNVLLAAKERWGIEWKHLDPSEVLRTSKPKTAKQLVFSFLDAMREDDIEIVEVTPDSTTVLRVSLKIRIPV